MGPAQAPPRSPDQDELDALIEEARRRAWRRRRWYGLALIVVFLIGIGLYLGFFGIGAGGGGSLSPDGSRAGGGAVNASAQRAAQLKPCPTKSLKQPAGHDVFVTGISCGQVGIPPITGSYRAQTARPVMFRSGKWTCWQRLIEGGATTDNVCWRGSQLVTFQFSG
jgi:hypothetical protein